MPANSPDPTLPAPARQRPAPTPAAVTTTLPIRGTSWHASSWVSPRRSSDAPNTTKYPRRLVSRVSAMISAAGPSRRHHVRQDTHPYRVPRQRHDVPALRLVRVGGGRRYRGGQLG